MTDVDDYSQLIGATPEAGPDGIFEGTSEEYKAMSRFVRYVTKVWAYENPVPDRASDLLQPMMPTWLAAQREYEADGGDAHLGKDGGSLFETWVAQQLFAKTRYTVLLSESFASMPIDGVTRVQLLSPQELLSALEIVLPLTDGAASAESGEIPALVSLGNAGHVIQLRSASPSLDEIRYHDPWPGPSLLCDANNRVGVCAKLMSQDPVRWRITPDEFMSAVCALIVPTQMLSWSPYGERLCDYETLKRGELFEFFRLRETERFQPSEAITVQCCETSAEGHVVKLEFLLDDEGMVRLVHVLAEPEFARAYLPLMADLLVHVVGAVDSCGMTQTLAMAVVAEALEAEQPVHRIGATVQTDLGFIESDGEQRFFAEVRPA